MCKECCTSGHCHTHHHEHHHHEHEHGGLKGKIILVAITVVLLIGAVLIEKHASLATWQLLLVYLVPYLLIGHDTLKEAAEGVMDGDMFNEHFLMSIATIGALCIGFLPGTETEFTEAVFVMLFFQVGELFEGYATNRSRESISHLMDIRPDVANVERDGSVAVVSPDEVAVGETIVIRPGEKVALDGKVVEGSSALIKVCTTSTFGDSTVSKIIKLVESADENKSKSESFITRFARVYTPIVVFLAIALAVIPPLAISLFSAGTPLTLQLFTLWLSRALIFLVVSCPCALVISVPLTFFGGIGGASRAGILIKGSNYMDALANVDTVVFDKTGTLTHGQFEVSSVHHENFDERELLHLVAHVEHFTTHPIGAALCAAFPDATGDDCEVADVEEVAGHGIRAKVAGRKVLVGNTKMMSSEGIAFSYVDCAGTVIHVAVDGQYAGYIVIKDKVKADSRDAIAKLKTIGVKRVVMLTGDRREVADEVAKQLGIEEYSSELLPADKVAEVERLLGEKGENKGLAFVGDGINDAPVLKRADVGIAMGALGSDAAIESADIVLMDDNTGKIATAISIARRTIAIARQNIWFAIGVKVAVLIFASFGIATMGMAVFADVGVMVLAVLNAMRALKAEPAFTTGR